MAGGERLGASFSIDVSDLKAGLAQANRLIKESKSEFKAAAAGMDDWRKSEDGLIAKKKELNSTLKVQEAVLSAYKKQMEEAGYAEDDMSKEAVELRTKINNQQAAVNKTTKELSQMDDILEEVRNSSDDASDEVDDLADSFEDAEKSSKVLHDGFGAMKVAIGNLISQGISKCVDAVKGLVDEAISASDSLYKFEQTMGFAGYDDKTIKKAKKDMKDYADKTVYDLDTISNTTAQLAANGIDDYTGLTEAAGNLNAVAGGNSDTFKSVAMMLTQTAGAGKLTTENWNQLADAIPGASGKLQESLKKAGAYTGDFREAMAKGEITSDEFNAAIMELGNEPVAVEAAKSVDTFEGAVGNMQATVVNGLMEIIDKIGMENITGFINKATKGVEWLIDNLSIVGTAIGGITTAIIAQNAANKIKLALDGAQLTATGLLTAAQKGLNAAMKANMVGIIITAITALVAAFMYLWKNCEGFRNFWIGLWDGIKKAAVKAWDGIKFVFSTVISFYKTIFTGAFNIIKTVFGKVPAFFSGIWNNIKAKFSSVKSFFSEKFSGAYNAVKNVFTKLPTFFSNLWGRIKSTFTGLGEKIASAISDAVKSGINGVISMIENTINGAITLINGAIKLANKLPGVNVGLVDKVDLPRLAKGGVVTSATTAMIGEDGAEAVVPLERNTEWIDKVAEKIKSAGGGVVVNQTNNYSQAHSRYEIYKSKQQTAAAVRLALGRA